MSIHHICFYGEIMKIISKLSSDTLLICFTDLPGLSRRAVYSHPATLLPGHPESRHASSSVDHAFFSLVTETEKVTSQDW